MRNLYFVLAIILTLSSCKAPEADGKTEKISGRRIEITPYFETAVVLRDTTTIKTAYLQSDSGKMAMFLYNQYNDAEFTFLTGDQFKVVKNAMWQMMYQPGSNVYFDVFSPPVTSKELKEKMIECDSIIETNFDANGKETIRAMWCCDSVSLVNRINMIKFYEAWYYNPTSRMIEKDLLGYSVLLYNDERRSFRNLFNVFKDKEAVKVVQKKWSW